MPHCVIECPIELKGHVCFSDLVKAVHDSAEQTNLFEPGDVKARIVSSENYLVGGQKEHYVHTVVHILAGRKVGQKKLLADSITATLCKLLPDVKMISVEVRDICKATYSNRLSVEK